MLFTFTPRLILFLFVQFSCIEVHKTTSFLLRTITNIVILTFEIIMENMLYTFMVVKIQFFDWVIPELFSLLTELKINTNGFYDYLSSYSSNGTGIGWFFFIITVSLVTFFSLFTGYAYFTNISLRYRYFSPFYLF